MPLFLSIYLSSLQALGALSCILGRVAFIMDCSRVSSMVLVSGGFMGNTHADDYNIFRGLNDIMPCFRST